ncbi:hypothetical protein D9758_003667 [Tetrapyrgos nigripes]|uniref:Uncharacterized protein n=1 Tax=Tetrapyrgos nigripes TaxID=182062 RepID=A0A8H5GLZ6_9AGAR|nr:hypothetical protein D9758_003667 [Tetrapyrgos nigripes]
MVPSDTTEEEMSGRLYANVDTVNSVWQLEPRSSRLSHGHRSRTTSTASTTSTQSSYAIISDPEISSSFAASLTLESGQVSESDAEDSLGPSQAPSPGLSSPYSSADEAPTQQARGFGPGFQPSGTGLRTGTTAGPRSNSASRGVSPGHAAGTTAHNANAALSADGGAGAGVITLHSLPPSFSSLESLSTTADSGRLLTLHLEKEQPAIWPSLITGPVPESMAPSSVNANSMYNSNSLTYAYVTDGLNASHELEHRYNMDPTSLTLMALELFDIRKDKEEAFEFFLRAWHLAHSPTATMKLVTYYLPIHVSYNIPSLAIDSLSSSSSSSQSQTLLTPGTGSSAPEEQQPITSNVSVDPLVSPGSTLKLACFT